MIVRWGLDTLPGLLGELGITDPIVITSPRWSSLELPVERRFTGVLPHSEVGGVQAAIAAAEGADGLVAVGGGSAIDTTKATSSHWGVPMVSVPTTYSGAEWNPGFGVRNPESGTKDPGGGARLAGIVYDPELTLDLPPGETGGTALNALAHCAEGLYAPNRTAETDASAVDGAGLISATLPGVMADGHDRDARRRLLEGAGHAGAAMLAGMGLGHAMAQALGGRYGLSHGAMNAVCLPPALRFNAEVAADAIARFAAAMETGDAVARVEELAALAGPTRLRDHDVPRDELRAVAEATAVRGAALANPRPASVDQILVLLEEVW